MSAEPTPSTSGTKRQRKANYGDHEIRILLEEVMLARTVLFSAFSNKITLQEKNKAWDRVAGAVTACGIARRSRVEVKEKWKAMKADVLGRQRRSGQTGGGPPDTPLPFEESILQIIGADSNLFQGVTTSYALSYLGPVAATTSSSAVTASTGLSEEIPEADLRWSHTVAMSGVEGQYTLPEAATSFSVEHIARPMRTSTPLGPASLEATNVSLGLPAPFNLSAGGASVSMRAGCPGEPVTVMADPEDAARPPSSGSSSRARAARGRSRSRPHKEFPGQAAEREAFMACLESTTQKNAAKTTVLNARVEHEAAERERADAKGLLERDLLVLKYRRELLTIETLEREGEMERVRVDRELVTMRLRRETLEVAKLEREMGGRV